MTISIVRLLDTVMKQLASEAFIVRDGDVLAELDTSEIAIRLGDGNGHISKFLPTQAAEFLDRYEILAQYRNDPVDPKGTGFSGTLVKDRRSGALTLSFRSTEFIEDAVRDSVSTNELEVKELGWALGQISVMESWYRELRSDPQYLQGKQFHVTGYSLGGHLATAFNLLRREEVAQGDSASNPILSTVTFNGAGVGGLRDGASLRGILARFERLRSMPDVAQSADWIALSEERSDALAVEVKERLRDIRAEEKRLETLEAQFAFGVRPRAGDQASWNYQAAALLAAEDAIPVTRAPFAFGGTNWIPTSPVFATERIAGFYEVVGSDAGNLGPSFVANSGVHYGERVDVYIEDQPLTRGTYFLPYRQGEVASNPDRNDFADTHSLLLLVDSLSLFAAFERLDPTFTLDTGSRILAAASAASASRLFGTQGRSEGDTLERTLDALAQLVLGPATLPILSDYSPTLAGNTWHLDEFRLPFHARLEEVQRGIGEMGELGEIRFVAIGGLEQGVIAQRARDPGMDGDAYRYALRELNPFVAVGFGHAAHGPLGVDSGGGAGFTEDWIDARAEMMVAMARENRLNRPGIVAGRGFLDLERDVRVGRQSSLVDQSVFGTPGDDEIAGGRMNDRLFGGAGRDRLTGGDSRDYLEGGEGEDRLEGGAGDDRLVGGTGFDTYVIDAGGGRDRILDADGVGRVQFLGRDLAGGDEVAPRSYEDASGTRYVLLDAADGAQSLLINGVLEIEDFESGDLGIVLRAADPEEPVGHAAGFIYLDTLYPVSTPQGTGDDRFVASRAGGSDGDDTIVWTDGGRVLARGGKDDVRVSGEGSVFVIGGSGDDDLDVHAALPVGESVVAGGSGKDTILGSERGDILVGDNWQVAIGGPSGPFGARIDGFFYDLGYAARGLGGIDPSEVALLGRAGAYDAVALRIAEAARSFADPEVWDHALDVVREEGWVFPDGFEGAVAYVQGPAPVFDDYIEGNGGDDTIVGGSGSDVVYGGDGHDRIEGDGQPIARTVIGPAEMLEPLAPYFGVPGDDVLDGGPGNDEIADIHGGSDYLEGGVGDDVLSSYDPDGEVTFNVLDGGDGDDLLQAGGDPGGFDILLGGPGNDILEAGRSARLEGGAGDDLYRFTDAIIRDTGGVDRIQSLGIVPPRMPAQTPEMLQSVFDQVDDYGTRQSMFVTRDGMDLVYEANVEGFDPVLGEYGDHFRLVIEDWHAEGDHRIEWIDAWSADDFERFGSSHFGAAEAIVVEGGDYVDRMFGSMADDFLTGEGGADLLAGRRGDDLIDGGEGDDQYFFGRGHGHDVVFDDAGRDDLRLAPGLSAVDVSLAFSAEGLRIAIADGSVTLAGVGPAEEADDLPIDRIVFADGTSMDLAAAIAQVPVPEEPAVAADGTDPPAEPPVTLVEPAPVPPALAIAPAIAPAIVPAVIAARAASSPVPALEDPPPPVVRFRNEEAQGRAGFATPDDDARMQEVIARVGESFDPVYREIDARLDVLLQAGRAAFSERYAEAIVEFNRRFPPEVAPAPPPTDDELASWNDTMHAWHAANPTFDVGESGRADGTWIAGWGSPTGGSTSLDELVAAGGTPALSNPLAARLQGVKAAPGLAEGLSDLRG